MMNSPASAAVQAGRYLLALTLVLTPVLGFTAAQTPRPTAAPVPLTYYLDGKQVDKAAFEKIDGKTVAYVNELAPDKARLVFGAASHNGAVLVIVTKANQNSAAGRALNAKVDKVAPLVPGNETPAEVNVLTSKALAHITKTYPNSRIIGVTKLSYPTTGQMRYKVKLAEGRRPHYALFDEQGNPVKP